MERINKYLDQIEKNKGVKILLACETGSRAWGFPSPDSDFDIRIIYVHPRDWYLSLSEKKDAIDLMFEDNEIDITGWDLRKSLRLLKKSNAAILERIQSSIIYRQDEEFVKKIRELAPTSYSRIATIHHYLSMAKNFWDEINASEEYRLKKFFYALRSAMATKWILEKEEMVPIEFMVMVENLEFDESLKNRIRELITLKSTINEGYLHKGEAALFQFIEDCIQQADAKRNDLPGVKKNGKELDAFFIGTLNH